MTSIHYRSLGMATVAIAGLPTLWNIVARNEYRRHTIERALGGKKAGAYCLAAAIFLASGVRDYLFYMAIANTPGSVLPIIPTHILGAAKADVLHRLMQGAGTALMMMGTTLVVSSFLRLGVTGTYLGDYFGILMKERVTAFPFSQFSNPMYLGATLNFLAASVAQNSAVGALLSAWVALVYHVSTKYFESPFTEHMYSRRDPEHRTATEFPKSEKKH